MTECAFLRRLPRVATEHEAWLIYDDHMARAQQFSLAKQLRTKNSAMAGKKIGCSFAFA